MILLSLATVLLAQADTDWDAQALQLEYEGSYDQAVIARIEAIRAADSIEEGAQQRRELTRQLRWYEGLVSTVRGHFNDSHATGGRIAVVDHELRVHDAYTGRRLYDPVPVGASPWVQLAEEAPRAVVVNSDPTVLQVFELETGRSLFRRPFRYRAHAISPDGQTLALSWAEGKSYGVDFVNLENGEESRVAVEDSVHGEMYALEFSPDGGSLLCTFGDFIVFDVAASTSTRVHPAVENSVDWSPTRREWINGGRQVADSYDGIGIWDCATATWKVQGLWPGESPEDLAFHAGEGILTVVGYEDAYQFSIETGEPLGRPLVPDDAVIRGGLAAEYFRGVGSDDGRVVAALGDWGRVRVWDTRSGKKLAREFGHGRLRARYLESEIELSFVDSQRFAARVPDQFVRVWEVGEEIAEATDIPEGYMSLAEHRAPSPRCAVARLLARTFVYSSSGPPRELPLPDGRYSGFSITESGDRAFFSGEDYGVWEVSLSDFDRTPRLVTEISHYRGVEANPSGSQFLVNDYGRTDVFDAATGVPTMRLNGVDGRPHVLDDEGRLHVYFEGSWRVADGAMAWRVWDGAFGDEVEEERTEGIVLRPFHHSGTLALTNWDEGETFEATWNPEFGEPITTTLWNGVWDVSDLRSLLTDTTTPAFTLYNYSTRMFTVYDVTTGEKLELPWKGFEPMQFILGDDRLLIASEEEVVLLRISDGSVLAKSPRLSGLEKIALIPGHDAFMVMLEQGCIDGFNALTGERVGPRWWSGAYRLSLVSDDGETAIATDGDTTYEYSYAKGAGRVVPSAHGPDPAEPVLVEPVPGEPAPADGPLLIARVDWSLATVKDGQAIPGPTRRGVHRNSGAWFYGRSSHRFLNKEKTIALLGVSASSKGLEFHYADFRPSRLEPTQGDAEALSREWCRRLALKIENGVIFAAR